MARTEHARFFNACEMPEYEELLAIGIIAVQVMIKNKTPEQLENTMLSIWLLQSNGLFK